MSTILKAKTAKKSFNFFPKEKRLVINHKIKNKKQGKSSIRNPIIRSYIFISSECTIHRDHPSSQNEGGNYEYMQGMEAPYILKSGGTY